MTLRLTRAQVREIDRRATAEYGIPSIVLMENAARSAADVAMEMLAEARTRVESPFGDYPYVEIYCGGGNNGGDGFAIARHLHNRGVNVRIRATWSKPPAGDAAINLAIIERMGARAPYPGISPVMPQVLPCDLLIDAMFGTGLTRPLEAEIAEIVDGVSRSKYPVLAIDLPSGLDCDTGEPLGPCVRATKTVTFVAEKAGFANPRSREFTGEIVIGDIGVPPELISAVATGGQ